MTLLQRVLSDKRPILGPIIIVLLANLALYAFAVYPLGRRQAGIAQRAAAAAAAREAAEAELAAAQALVEGKGRAEEELTTFYEKVLPANMSEARRMTYATLPALARKTNVTFLQRRTEIEQSQSRENAKLNHLAIRIVLEGSYEDIRRFIYELESAPDFVIIDDVTLAQNDPARPLSLTVALSAYYRLGPNGI